MLRLQDLSLQYKRRPLRVLYGNTQAYPYAATLSANFDRTLGQLSGGSAVTGSFAAILPGSVAEKLAGEVVTLAGSPEGSATDTVADVVRAFGLFANFVGGTLDELGTRSEVGVWRGPGSVYEVLAPAFNSTGLSAAIAAEDGSAAGKDVFMIPGTDGRLVYDAAATAPFGATGSKKAVVRGIDFLSANAIIVECLV